MCYEILHNLLCHCMDHQYKVLFHMFHHYNLRDIHIGKYHHNAHILHVHRGYWYTVYFHN